MLLQRLQLKDADVVAKRIYQSEAETIDKIQKSIIAISQKEAPYDIFICYKESDENGSRTRDSFVAEDIYNELTQKNYKVFNQSILGFKFLYLLKFIKNIKNIIRNYCT